MTLYPDASVIVASVTNEAGTASAVALLEGRPAGELVATDWLLLEVALALAIKVRVGTISPDDRVQSLARATAYFRASFTLLAIDREHYRRAITMIGECPLPLRGGDALHLAIAASYGATVWTYDRRMAAAGVALGIDAQMLV